MARPNKKRVLNLTPRTLVSGLFIDKMERDKKEIIKKHCYTELVYQRINKKLGTSFSNKESELLLKRVLKETGLEGYEKKGKNFYISNKQHNIKVTINSNTFRVITVDKILMSKISY